MEKQVIMTTGYARYVLFILLSVYGEPCVKRDLWFPSSESTSSSSIRAPAQSAKFTASNSSPYRTARRAPPRRPQEIFCFHHGYALSRDAAGLIPLSATAVFCFHLPRIQCLLLLYVWSRPLP